MVSPEAAVLTLTHDLRELDTRVADLLDVNAGQSSLATEFLHVAKLADLPTAGLGDGAVAFATDGRKDAEGADAGTGVPVWWNDTDSTWRTFTTGAEVQTTTGSAGDHAASHAEDGADELNVEDLGTTGGAGTVPVSDGAGGLDMTDLATQAELDTHEAASDPHTGYRLESADHSHASAGAQAGTVSHDVLDDVSTSDHHVKYTDAEALAAGQDDATSDPLQDADAASDGTEESFARKDHVHPKHHAEAHTAASHSDQGATGSELETLTDGSDADSLHDHGNHGITHNAAHTAASHSDQGATGAELETLTDGSDADALHAHSAASLNDVTEWTTYTPSFTGFSSAPTGQTARYKKIGKTVHVSYTWQNVGVTNATAITVTLPVAAAATGVPQWGPIRAYDNGSYKTTWGAIATRSNSATADLYTDGAGGAWTNGGNTGFHFTFTYEAAS